MTPWDRCALCPRLCHAACPVALGSGREAAVPAVIANIMLLHHREELPDDVASQALTLCVDCGACQEHCHLDVPLPAALREARARLLPRPPIEPLRLPRGEGRVLAVESDDRRWAEALGRVLETKVIPWRTGDELGVRALHHPGFEARLDRIRTAVAGRDVVVIAGGVAEVLTAAGVRFRWLRELLPQLPGGAGSCRRGGERPFACCGGAPPLVHHHPDDARRLGRLWLDRDDRWQVEDARCRAHLRNCGAGVRDPVDALLAEDFVR